MTMLNHEPLPPVSADEAEHLAMFEASHVAKHIAMSALRVVISDATSAFRLLDNGSNTDEAVQIIAEARDQLQYAQSILNGKVWTLVL